MTDDQARNVQQYEYDSFGNQHDMKNRIKQPYGYTGREHDRETGLRYYRARYYDGEIGRFISEDPIGFAGGDVNLYSYVWQNPVRFLDPNGKAGDTLALLLFHYGRNFFNEKVSAEEAMANWDYQGKERSVFHQQGPGNEGNLKYLSPDKHSEIVIRQDGSIDDSALNRGTYNYAAQGSLLGDIGHVIFDVLPYLRYGNSIDDPSNIWQRLELTYQGLTTPQGSSTDDCP